MTLSKNHFIINLIIGMSIIIAGFIANITASVIINDYSYLYGFLLGSTCIIMWIGFYFLLFKQNFLLKKKDQKKKNIKWDVFVWMLSRTLLLLFPFLLTMIIILFWNKTFNPISVISINITFILIVRLVNFIYIGTSKK